MESLQLEHENVTELVVVIIWDVMEKVRREENDLIYSKELNKKSNEVKI